MRSKNAILQAAMQAGLPVVHDSIGVLRPGDIALSFTILEVTQGRVRFRIRAASATRVSDTELVLTFSVPELISFLRTAAKHRSLTP